MRVCGVTIFSATAMFMPCAPQFTTAATISTSTRPRSGRMLPVASSDRPDRCTTSQASSVPPRMLAEENTNRWGCRRAIGWIRMRIQIVASTARAPGSAMAAANVQTDVRSMCGPADSLRRDSSARRTIMRCTVIANMTAPNRSQSASDTVPRLVNSQIDTAATADSTRKK